jgi:hypothetical protein
LHVDNNLRIRDLRKYKNRQKMTEGFRTHEGAQMHCRIQSCIEICNTNSKHERIVVPDLSPCSIVGCSVSVAALRFPPLLLAVS